jgi:queuine tRNA-ribosyltransferase
LLLTIKTLDGVPRRGFLTLPHGTAQTPSFMPVGTSGAVKAMTAEDLEELGAEIVLGNTYHLYLRPGVQIVRKLGGLAAFSGWPHSTLTDSGGYQVFSLQHISHVTDEGVEFQSHHDGSRHLFTAENVTEVQFALGADIAMAFDQCVPYPCDKQTAAIGVKRTFDWAKRCKARFAELSEEGDGPTPGQIMFGIVQGSVYNDLRSESAKQITSLDFPGYAIGGLSVGESKAEMEDTLAHAIQFLPADRPRYLMGVGYPEDILMAVSHGVDMFDCVLPTRNARTGQVFTSLGPLVYRNADCADDESPLDPNCDCRVCLRYSRAYLRHMFNQGEITGMVLATYHSCFFYQNLMRQIRQAIERRTFESFRKSFLEKYLGGRG